MARKLKISSVESILQSEGWQDVIKLLEAQHPLRKKLDHNATTEMRANYQIAVEQYESILFTLRALPTVYKAKTVESTYEEPKK